MRGTKVHFLVTDQTRTPELPVHLLVPNPANSASNWLDVLAELRPHAHAIAVDLPGTIADHTALPNRRAASIETNALFLRDFGDALELARVVVHGWSAGGMIALLFADQAPVRVARLVLVVPATSSPAERRRGAHVANPRLGGVGHRRTGRPCAAPRFGAAYPALRSCGYWTIPGRMPAANGIRAVT